MKQQKFNREIKRALKRIKALEKQKRNNLYPQIIEIGITKEKEYIKVLEEIIF
jgi:hypothetical protein